MAEFTLGNVNVNGSNIETGNSVSSLMPSTLLVSLLRRAALRTEPALRIAVCSHHFLSHRSLTRWQR
jgi:hypothetical protein